MKLTLQVIYLSSILVSAVMALAFYRKLLPRKLALLAFFLPLVFIQEMILMVYEWVNILPSTALVYNIYKPISVIVFAIFYWQIPLMKNLQKLIGIIALVHILATLLDYFVFESIYVSSSYLTLARGFVITCFGLLFLYTYFNLDNPAAEQFWRPVLWITVGIVAFYPVISISLAFQKFLAPYNTTIYGFKLYQVIPQVMSIFMYSCFSFAFYLCKKKN